MHVDHAIKEYIKKEYGDDPNVDDYCMEDRSNEIKEQISRWIKWGEYLTVEFDLDNGTASVKEA